MLSALAPGDILLVYRSKVEVMKDTSRLQRHRENASVAAAASNCLFPALDVAQQHLICEVG